MFPIPVNIKHVDYFIYSVLLVLWYCLLESVAKLLYSADQAYVSFVAVGFKIKCSKKCQ